MVAAPIAEHLMASGKAAKDSKKTNSDAVAAKMGGVMPMSSCTLPLAECEDAMSSSSSGKPRVPRLIANSRYQICKKLGSGSYSDVYLAMDADTGDQLAAKFEWIHADKTGKLLAEAELCRSLNKDDGSEPGATPFVRWVGSQGEFNIMVMDVLGPSLEDLMEKCGGSLSLRTVLMLGEQMVGLLEYVHSHGIIHRDIKPNNFLIGAADRRDRVYIVDFGLSRKYIDASTGEHIPNKEKKGLTGTVRYTTKNIHDGQEPSRRDDLGSVGYVLMYLALGRLPWQGVTAKSKKTKQRRIGRRKERVTHEELCEGFPPELCRFLQYCDGLDYAEQPDYRYLRELMTTALERDLRPGERPVFDWMLPEDQRPPPVPNAKRKGKKPVEQAAADDVRFALAEAQMADTPLASAVEAKRRRLENGQKAGALAAGPVPPQANEEDSSYSYEYETEESSYEETEEEEESESEPTEVEETAELEDKKGKDKKRSKA